MSTPSAAADPGDVKNSSSIGISRSNNTSNSIDGLTAKLGRGSRTLSASTLKDALSKLAAGPLHVSNPVAALQANVE